MSANLIVVEEDHDDLGVDLHVDIHPELVGRADRLVAVGAERDVLTLGAGVEHVGLEGLG